MKNNNGRLEGQYYKQLANLGGESGLPPVLIKKIMEEKAKKLYDNMRGWTMTFMYGSCNIDHEQAKRTSLICAKMLAIQEDEYNNNDPMRKSDWWLVVDTLEKL